MYNHDLTDRQFGELSPDDFFLLMAKETKVSSKREFAETMRCALRDVSKLIWSTVVPNTHEKFFQGVLKRKKLYEKAFQMMMVEKSNRKHCPNIEGKDFGLAKIFLDMFEYSYVKTVLAEILKINATNYKQVSDFLSTFVEHASNEYQASRNLRKIPYASADFINLPTKSSSDRSSGDTKPSGGSSVDKKPWHRPDHKKVHNLTCRAEDSSDSEEERRRPTKGSQPRKPDSDDDSLEDVKAPTEPSHEMLRNLEGDPEELLQALDAATQTRGCLYYTVYGKCFRDKECKNVMGHNEKIAKETRQWLIRKLTAMENEGTGPPKILTRERESR